MLYDNEEHKFWNHVYEVSLFPQTNVDLVINADYIQHALDEAVDIAEDRGWEGAFISWEEAEEDGYIDDDGNLIDIVVAGNHSRLLPASQIHVRKVE